MKPKMRHSWIALILFAVTGCSKYGTVEGQLVDGLTGLPVAGAVVSIKGTAVEAYTDKDGTFILKEVVPGAQEIAVKGRFFVPAASQVSVSAGTKVKMATARVLPAPDTPGLYSLTSDGITAIYQIPSKQLDLGYGGVTLVRNPNAANQKIPGKPVQLMLYTTDSASSNIGVFPIKYEINPWRLKGFANSEDYYEVRQPNVQGLKIENLQNGPRLITGQLAPGRYCLVRKEGFGIGDLWCFHVGTG